MTQSNSLFDYSRTNADWSAINNPSEHCLRCEFLLVNFEIKSQLDSPRRLSPNSPIRRWKLKRMCCATRSTSTLKRSLCVLCFPTRDELIALVT